MIKRTLILLLGVLNITITTAQDVYYYKLIRKMENNVSIKDVSGGQFITFSGNKCFESNKKGLGVGHGVLIKNLSYSNSEFTTYQGSSYWGKETTFKFNADKSVLNVVLENGDVYVYKRATPPAGQETCSLIRKSGESGGGYTSTPVYPPQPNPVPPPFPPPAPTPNSPIPPAPESRHGSYVKEETCPSCHGTKTCETCLGRGWRNNPYTNQHDTCPICRGRKTCQTCNGTGKVSKTVYY